MFTLTQRVSANPDSAVTNFTLSLTAEERTRSRHRFQTLEGNAVYLHLPRGTVLRDGDLLADETGTTFIRILAEPEPVLTAIAESSVTLLRAAYHLGNRHVSLEIAANYLRLSPDPVLKQMLEQLGLQVLEEIAPFHPEAGAYSQSHSHHSHSH